MPDTNSTERLSAFINESPTIAERAGADLASPAHKAAMYDANGDVVIATSSDKAIGLFLSDSADLVTKGSTITVLISCIGLLEASGAIAKGDAVTIGADGRGKAAADGDTIFGRAFTAAPGVGALIQVRI